MIAQSAAPSGTGSVTDEIREYKKLLDEGIITQEEFDAKKKQLMGLDD
ncbi:MAG: SHOCT domain-containing protein [Clostridia bacterium]|nr:SHOCT domain-containing protein [Clostridia bacterium]